MEALKGLRSKERRRLREPSLIVAGLKWGLKLRYLKRLWGAVSGRGTMCGAFEKGSLCGVRECSLQETGKGTCVV